MKFILQLFKKSFSEQIICFRLQCVSVAISGRNRRLVLASVGFLCIANWNQEEGFHSFICHRSKWDATKWLRSLKLKQLYIDQSRTNEPPHFQRFFLHYILVSICLKQFVEKHACSIISRSNLHLRRRKNISFFMDSNYVCNFFFLQYHTDSLPI